MVAEGGMERPFAALSPFLSHQKPFSHQKEFAARKQAQNKNSKMASKFDVSQTKGLMAFNG